MHGLASGVTSGERDQFNQQVGFAERWWASDPSEKEIANIEFIRTGLANMDVMRRSLCIAGSTNR